MSLIASTRSESTKLFSTSAWWILAIVLVVYVGSTAAGMGYIFAATAAGALPAGGTAPEVPAEGLAPLLYSLGTALGYVFPLLVGTLMVTSEFRHETLTPTFLATPRRGIVLWAKLLISILVGLLFGVLALASSVGPAAALLAGFGLDTGLGEADTWAMIGRSLIAFVLWAMVGIGVGALVRNQVVAIVLVLAFTQFIEPLLRLAASFVDGLADVARFLPGAAGDALVGASIYNAMGGDTGAQLEWWGGGLVLLAYALVLLLVGHIVSWTRDVT